jgi:hypothetical protein
MTSTQRDALRFLAQGGEQIKIRTARPLVAAGYVEIPASWQRQYETVSGSGWTRATLTDAGRKALS